MKTPGRPPQTDSSVSNPLPYHVTVFTTPTSRARKITTSDTPSSFEDAAQLARKAALVSRIRNAFLVLLCMATAAFGVSLLAPRLQPYDQEGLPRLAHSLRNVTSVPMRQKVLGYKREAFGTGWIITPGSSCDTRQVVMFSQSSDSPDCAMKSTELFDPYAQMLIPADDIEVDHIFPLSAAWDHGAHAWDDQTRQKFANDPLNLVATSRTLNQEKSDALPDEWLPPHPSAGCWYAERVAAIASSYSLSLSEQALGTMKNQCQLGIPFL